MPVFDYTSYGDTSVLAAHPHDPGVLLGGVGALHRLPDGVDAVVSLCRLGTSEVPAPGVDPREHVEVWLVDRADPAKNPNLDVVLYDTARTVAALRAEGHTVLVHCVQAISRTPTVAAAHSILNLGVPLDASLADISDALHGAWPNRGFLAALDRLAARRV